MTAAPPDARPVAVVTGATGGIGRWIARGLAQAGHHVVLVGRDASRAQAAMAWIAAEHPSASLEVMLADLSLLSETRALAGRIAAAHPRIAVLVANAGVFCARRTQTAEGHEMVLAVNHLSPFVLIGALVPALSAGAPARVVIVGSSTSDRARIDSANLELVRGWGMVRAYGQSKLAVMMAGLTWAETLRGAGVTVNVVHPGTVATGLVRTPGVIGLAWRLMAPFSRSAAQGAETPLFVALSPDVAGVTGAYFKDCRVARANPRVGDRGLVAAVWAATQGLV
jgi:NAD(P)-dependent dehydrogenase (short-subunit alcohol dehydrogenase family)